MPERNCQSCQPHQKIQWGCKAPAAFATAHLDGEPLLRCPLRFKLENPAWFVTAYQAWHWREKGFLPNAGSWQDQPFKFSQLCDVIDSAMSEADAETQAQRKAQADREKRVAAVHGHGGKPPVRAGGGRR